MLAVRALGAPRESVQAARTEFRGRTCECIHRTPAGAEAERALGAPRESVQAARTEFRGRTCECIHRTPAGAEAERAGIPLPGTALPETGTPRETAVPPAFPQATA